MRGITRERVFCFGVVGAMLIAWYGPVELTSRQEPPVRGVHSGPASVYAEEGSPRKKAEPSPPAAASSENPQSGKANDKVKDEVKVKDVDDGVKVEQTGEASWYGSYHHGKKTASGEKYNQHDMTAAHPTLPLGTEATVTNLETGESVEVEINDRGPYVKSREIDLSRAAAKEIGATEDGVAPVKIEAHIPGDSTAAEDPAELKEKIQKKQPIKENLDPQPAKEADERGE
ncbi:MAG: septal ring lytic transglycosylase RlpA family protein [Thermodesulfobacteriota bacterium]|jgi:rare lipoprotein A